MGPRLQNKTTFLRQVLTKKYCAALYTVSNMQSGELYTFIVLEWLLLMYFYRGKKVVCFLSCWFPLKYLIIESIQENSSSNRCGPNVDMNKVSVSLVRLTLSVLQHAEMTPDQHWLVAAVSRDNKWAAKPLDTWQAAWTNLFSEGWG